MIAIHRDLIPEFTAPGNITNTSDRRVKALLKKDTNLIAKAIPAHHGNASVSAIAAQAVAAVEMN